MHRAELLVLVVLLAGCLTERVPDFDEQRRGRASYLAKYTTKSTEQAGGLLHRITRDEVEHAPVSEHNRRYLTTAFELHDRVSEAIAADPPPALPASAGARDQSLSQRTDPADRAGDEHRRAGPDPGA